MFHPTRAVAILALALGAASAPATAQHGPAPVHFTEAREIERRAEVRLPGTVESRLSSVVAGEVAGKVLSIEVQDGERARKGQVLARLRPNAYRLLHNEAQARLEESRARLKLAESSLKRARELFDDEVVSQQHLDDAISEYTAWQNREAQNRAQIDQLELSLELLNVRAPFDGIVTRKRTDVGQWVVSGGPVAEMVSLNKLEVRVDVPERYYDSIRIGSRVGVALEALPDLELTGVVKRIIPRAADQARTFPVKISISNKDGRIGVGMLANVAMPAGPPTTSIVVPKDALIRTGPGEVVYRIADDDTAEDVSVRSGAGVGAWITVTGGIRPGDRVITKGNERLEPGQAVDGKLQEFPDP